MTYGHDTTPDAYAGAEYAGTDYGAPAYDPDADPTYDADAHTTDADAGGWYPDWRGTPDAARDPDGLPLDAPGRARESARDRFRCYGCGGRDGRTDAGAILCGDCRATGARPDGSRTADAESDPRRLRLVLPGAYVAPCGCVRRFVHGRLQSVRCDAHARAARGDVGTGRTGRTDA